MQANGRRILTVLVAVVVVGLCFGAYRLGVKQGRQMNTVDASNRIAGPESEAIIPDVKQDDFVSRNLPNALDELKGVVAAEQQEREGIESAQKERLMRNLEANLELPGMNRIIREQQRVLMADQFSALIETYGLNDEEKEYFLDLLTARQMYHVDLGMKLMTGMLSEEERTELLQRVGAGIDEMNKEIDWFLNNKTDSEYFDYYERTEGERSIVESVSDQLTQSGSPLKEGMDMELIAIMHEQLSSYPFSVNLEENGEPVFPNFTSDNIDTFVREMQDLRDPMMQEAAAVLTPEQLEVFAGAFEQYVAFYDQRLRMVQQLFNPAQ